MRTLFIAFGFAILVASCAKQPDSIHLSGQFEDPQDERLYLYRSADRYSYKAWTKPVAEVALSPEGKFAFTVQVDQPDYYQVVGDQGFPIARDVYLAAGDSIQLDIPIRSDTTRIQYKGARSEAYGVYDKIDSLWRNDPSFELGYYEIAQMDIDSAWEFLGERLQTITAVIDDHFEGEQESSVIESTCREQYKHRIARDHYDFLYYHNYYTKDSFAYLIPDQKYYSFLDDIDIQEVPDHFTYQYAALMSGFLRDRFQHAVVDLPDSVKYGERLPIMIDIANNELDGEARDWAYMSIANDFATYLDRDDFFELMDSMGNFLEANHQSAVVLNGFMNEKAEFENLRPGNMAPDFALPNVDGDTVRLSDLRGKVVYLDFWGTWCFPCLQEMPSSLELEEKMKGEDVEFVYVGLQSGDDQLEQWRDFVTGEIALSYAPFLEQQAYPGVHVVADGQFNNPSLKPFKLRMAPTYMLIDAEGKIVTADAPRPSSDKIEPLLRETLERI